MTEVWLALAIGGSSASDYRPGGHVLRWNR